MIPLIWTFIIFSKDVFRYVLSSILILLLVSCVNDSNNTTSQEDTTFELSNQVLREINSLLLKGNTLFYWKQWPIDQGGSFNADLLQKSDTIAWPTPLWTEKGYQATGYGTFRFFIKRNNIDKSYSLNLSRVFAGCEVWINGEKIAEQGQIAKESSEEKADGRPFRFKLPNEPLLDIMLLVSNHKHRLGGGFSLTNTIEEDEHLQRKIKNTELSDGVITFVVLLFGIYQILTFISLPKYRYFLFFGLYCLIGASRQLFVGEALVYNFFPDISFDIIQKIRYVCYYGGLAMTILYFTNLFPGYFSTKFIRSLLVFTVLGIIYVLCTSVLYATYSAPFFQVFGVIIVILGFYLLIRAVQDKRPYAKGMLISISVVGLLLLNDLLHASTIIQSGFVINYGFFLFVCFQAIINNRVQLRTEKELIKLSSDIDDMSTRIQTKEEEISRLHSESFQQLKSKEKLVENLKKVASNDETITIQNLISELRSELLEDSRLVLIKNDIETLNYEFAERLKKQHPNLTKTDVEICTYLRMSLSRKEIARLRFTSIVAVKKTRNRLRKKMNLSEETDLEDYIKSI